MKIKKILRAGHRYLSDPAYRISIHEALGFYDRLSDVKYLEKKYKAVFGRELCLDAPKTFNEKLQWLKLYNRRLEYTMMVDKYLVRDYIAKKIGDEYLIPLLGVWDDPDNIDFDALPNQFVLKCNHNSGLGMCICKDKSKLDIAKVKKELRKGLAQDYYLTGREWPYKNVPRKIIAEKYLIDSALGELRDFKFFCFDGQVKCFKVDFDRFVDHKANYFSPSGEPLPFGERVCPPDYKKKIDLPKNLSYMLDYAQTLSKGIPFLRVDFYEVDGQVYFGEMTFFPASGFGPFVPEEWDYKLGEWFSLPTKTEG